MRIGDSLGLILEVGIVMDCKEAVVMSNKINRQNVTGNKMKNGTSIWWLGSNYRGK